MCVLKHAALHTTRSRAEQMTNLEQCRYISSVPCGEAEIYLANQSSQLRYKTLTVHGTSVAGVASVAQDKQRDGAKSGLCRDLNTGKEHLRVDA